MALGADISVPDNAAGIVLFVHGSGSSRQSARNRLVAQSLRARVLGTVLMDLLTAAEERSDALSGLLRFDVGFLTRRVMAVVEQLRQISPLPLGLFGASTGAAAALASAAACPSMVDAVVSRGGRPDLAGAALPAVAAPTLLIVGARDTELLELNRRALKRLRWGELAVVENGSQLFQEPGALEEVAARAGEWFTHHLKR